MKKSKKGGVPLTRKKRNSKTYKNAVIYNNEDFITIPQDEEVQYNANSRNEVISYMNKLKRYKDVIEDLNLRPFKKYTREPIVGKIVGSEFKKSLKDLKKTGLLSKGKTKRKKKKKR